MIQLLIYWLNRDAKWWQFWFPQSGMPGGCIAGAINTTLIKIFIF